MCSVVLICSLFFASPFGFADPMHSKLESAKLVNNSFEQGSRASPARPCLQGGVGAQKGVQQSLKIIFYFFYVAESLFKKKILIENQYFNFSTYYRKQPNKEWK